MAHRIGRAERGRAMRTAAIAAVAALALAGCVARPSTQTTLPAVPFEAEPFSVSHDVRFAPQTVALRAGESVELAGFVNAFGVEPGDTVVVSGAGLLSAERRQLIAQELAAYGYPDIRFDHDGPVGDRIRVTLERTTYMPTSCTREGVIGTPNDVILLPQRCANDLNLARMVVDQRDLIEGRDLGPAPASTAVRAIGRYRADQVRELRIEKASEQ